MWAGLGSGSSTIEIFSHNAGYKPSHFSHMIGKCPPIRYISSLNSFNKLFVYDVFVFTCVHTGARGCNQFSFVALLLCARITMCRDLRMACMWRLEENLGKSYSFLFHHGTLPTEPSPPSLQPSLRAES